jgi:hypothetical protein
VNVPTDLLQSIALLLLGLTCILQTFTIRRLRLGLSSVRATLTTQKTPGQTPNPDDVRAALTVKRGGQ